MSHHLRAVGIEPSMHAQVVALEPGHPYLRLLSLVVEADLA